MLQLLPNTLIQEISPGGCVLKNGSLHLKLRHLSTAEKELLRHLQMPWKFESFQALAGSLGLEADATNNLLQILKNHHFLRQFSAGFNDVVPKTASEVAHAAQDVSAKASTVSGLKILLEILGLENVEDAQVLTPFLTTAADLLLVSRRNSVFLSYSGSLPEKSLPVKLQALFSNETAFKPDLVISVAARRADSFWGADTQMWEEQGVPLLAVGLWADSVQIGPLVKPTDAPCLKCLDLFENQSVPRPREGNLSTAELPQLADFPNDQLATGSYPPLPAALLVAAAAQVAAACENLSTLQRFLPGEVRYVDQDLLVERTLWPFNPQCDNHPLALPPVS